ncbi:unnamed protein product [Anisakis simplex]|uniref:Sperm flagellar protein 1 (inferred by orthology to a human protein) n=1 Tax=Anisakis simplex TaxID=6269 RepID=A0A0M3JSM9_ANISI|nr:unnamed protein product [Anisakis simplex]
MSLPTLDDNSVDDLYKWLSNVPFSKQIKNIAKDFSDGVLIAELVAHFLPRYISLANYTAVNSNALKRYNWETLNKMVFVHLNFNVNQNLIQKVTTSQPGAIEFILFRLRERIEEAIQEGRFRPSRRRSRSVASRGQSFIPAVKTVPFNRSAFCCATEASVSLQKYHQSQQEVLAKDEQIQKLYARIRHLERLVQLKDERISEMSKQMEKMMQMIYRDQQMNCTSTMRMSNVTTAMPSTVHHSSRTATPQNSSDGRSSTIITSSSSPIRDQTDSLVANSFIDLK